MSDILDALDGRDQRDASEEARLLLGSLDSCIHALENAHTDPHALDELYRSAHSLRAASAEAGLEVIARLSRAIQSAVLHLRSKRMEMSSGLLDSIREAAVAAGRELDARSVSARSRAQAGAGRRPGKPAPEILALESLLASLGSRVEIPGERSEPIALSGIDARRIGSAISASRTTILAVAKVLQSSTVIEATLRDLRVAADLREKALRELLEILPQRLSVIQKGEPIALAAKDLSDRLGALAGIGAEWEKKLEESLGEMSMAARDCARAAADTRDSVAAVGLIPIGPLLTRICRNLRGIAQKQGVKLSTLVEGGKTEVDASFSSALSEAIGHCSMIALGLDGTGSKRKRPGGRIRETRLRLQARDEGTEAMLAVRGDGRAVGRAAFSFDLSAEMSELSKLGCVIETAKGSKKGIAFSIRMPRSSPAAPFLLLRSGGSTWAVPGDAVRECLAVAPSETTMTSDREVLARDGTSLPVIRLEASGRASEAVVISDKGREAIVMVESIIGEERLIESPIARDADRTPRVAGTAILADGTIAQVLDVSALADKAFASARQRTRHRRAP